MNRAELNRNGREQIKAKYKSYINGEITRSQWLEYLLDLMENFIKYRIEQKHRLLGAEYDDLMQAGRLAIVRMADKYDPTKAMPSCFFQPYIDEEMKNILDNGPLSTHYVGAATRLDKVAKERGCIDCTDERLSAKQLHVLTGLSLRTVMETIRLKKCKNVSLEATSENMDLESSFPTPEKAILDKERNDILREHMEKLTPLERFLVTATILADERVSYRKLISIMRREDVQEEFADELRGVKVEQIWLEQKVQKALRKIKHNPSFKKYVSSDFRRKYDYTVIEQASESDIEDAIMNDIIDLTGER